MLCAAVNRPWVRRILRLFALISFVSVSMNTPKTFEMKAYLAYVTFVADLIVTFAFSAEMIAKMQMRGVIRVSYHLLSFNSATVAVVRFLVRYIGDDSNDVMMMKLFRKETIQFAVLASEYVNLSE